MQKPAISYADFEKLDLKVGTIIECLAVEGSEKLLNLTIDLGVEGKRTILSGIKKDFESEKLIGVQVLVLVNLEPKKMMGLESQGMILMAIEEDLDKNEKVTLLIPQNKTVNGAVVE